ncbi:MAG: hypothetical protein M3Y41_02805, partial [Pseudomonadota bacterium]|nr:hypothetical protein [Pseudomonadota bacterium]
VLKATSWLGDETVEATGGVIKGAGDLAAMGGNAIFHPIDAAESLGEGALGIAEHVPTVPGLNTTVKGIHGLVDLARGKTDGEYGGTLSDLGENLLLDTKEDPNNPGKKTNADVDFFAGIGGGIQAWTDKPVEAATRTITNLVPMFLGDEGAGGKPPPEGGPSIPEAPPPSAVDPMGKTQVDPMGKTQVDPMGKTQPQIDPQGPKTEVDPPGPGEPEAPKPDGPNTPKEAAQNVADASAAQKITQQASLDTAGEFVRYRAKMPVPERGFAGDPNWDPVVDEALFEESNRASQANIEAIHKLQAAQEAALNTPGFAKGFPPRR